MYIYHLISIDLQSSRSCNSTHCKSLHICLPCFSCLHHMTHHLFLLPVTPAPTPCIVPSFDRSIDRLLVLDFAIDTSIAFLRMGLSSCLYLRCSSIAPSLFRFFLSIRKAASFVSMNVSLFLAFKTSMSFFCYTIWASRPASWCLCNSLRSKAFDSASFYCSANWLLTSASCSSRNFWVAESTAASLSSALFVLKALESDLVS